MKNDSVEELYAHLFLQILKLTSMKLISSVNFDIMKRSFKMISKSVFENAKEAWDLGLVGFC